MPLLCGLEHSHKVRDYSSGSQVQNKKVVGSTKTITTLLLVIYMDYFQASTASRLCFSQ